MAMADSTDSNEERPCLHCLIGDLIDEFYAEYGSLSGEKDTVDVDEIITALAKTVAEMTFGSDAAVRPRILEDLVREISQFEAEYASAPGSDMRHFYRSSRSWGTAPPGLTRNHLSERSARRGPSSSGIASPAAASAEGPSAGCAS